MDDDGEEIGVEACRSILEPIPDERQPSAAYLHLSLRVPLTTEWTRTPGDTTVFDEKIVTLWTDYVLLNRIHHHLQYLIEMRIRAGGDVPESVLLTDAFQNDLPRHERHLLEVIRVNPHYYVHWPFPKQVLYGAVKTMGHGRGHMTYSIISIAIQMSSGKRHTRSFLTDGPMENHQYTKDMLRHYIRRVPRTFEWLHYGGDEGRLFGTRDVQADAIEIIPEDARELRFAVARLRGKERGFYSEDKVATAFWDRWTDDPVEESVRQAYNALPLPPCNDVNAVLDFFSQREFLVRACLAQALAVLEVHEALQRVRQNRQASEEE